MKLNIEPIFFGESASDIKISTPFLMEVFNSIDGSKEEYDEACCFLNTVFKKPNTYKTYRNAIEKLLLWSWLIKEISITALRPSDLTEMVDFLQNPEPEWVSPTHAKRFIGNKVNQDWRPLSTSNISLSDNSIKAMLSSLSAYYSFLIDDAEITQSNPALSARKRILSSTIPTTNVVDKLLTANQMQYIIRASREMGHLKPLQQARSRFIIALMFYRYRRISEISVREITDRKEFTPLMSHFKRIQGSWFFTIPAKATKGGKDGLITVTSEIMAELVLFRESISQHLKTPLTTYPSPTESTPLIPKISATGNITGGLKIRSIRGYIKAVFEQAVLLMEEDAKGSVDGAELQIDAEMLNGATAHMLRHSGISADVESGREMAHIRDDALHGDLSTTNNYVHTDLSDRAASAEKSKHKHIY